MTVVRSVAAMAEASDDELIILLGELNKQVAAKYAHHWNAQTRAWEDELTMLRVAVKDLAGAGFADSILVFEYEIPRRRRRPDLILVTNDALVVVEFKVGATTFDAASRWQAAEYALDLRDFHSESAGAGISCVVVATRATACPTPALDDRGIPLFFSNASKLGGVLVDAARRARAAAPSATPRPPLQWLDGKYRPTPNIIEAAEMLYKGHGVAEINHAYAQNLTETTDALVDIIDRASRSGERVICFVTGVPGAGKTLTGLDAVHDPRLRADGRPAGVFLSGNGPLVKVVQEALARTGMHKTKKEALRTVTTFVQNVHRFVGEYSEDADSLPPEHVVVFDEAQRAWSRAKMEKQRRGAFSEPEQMFEIMERFPDWAVIIALVGGGQEIHDGEAGLAAWGEALSQAGRKPWKVVASPDALTGSTAVSGHCLFTGDRPTKHAIMAEPKLHLKVSVRAPRARVLAEWVDAVLGGRPAQAARLAESIREFPLVGTRDLATTRSWLQTRADGPRTGLVASAGARRLRAYGIQLSTQVGQNSDIDQWFLAPSDDVRSSYSLEVAATEFECQGLELDYVGLCWGDDFTRTIDANWAFRRFVGTRWMQVKREEDRSFMVNKYRVLLTRARKGMIIWVPRGHAADPTRDPGRLDRTWEYLIACGMREVDFNTQRVGVSNPDALSYTHTLDNAGL